MSWQIVDSLLLAISLAGTVYLALAAARLAAFGSGPLELATELLPSVTVLKPIAGNEPGLYENLASFCEQDYDAPFEVIFCLHDTGDSARGVVERAVGLPLLAVVVLLRLAVHYLARKALGVKRRDDAVLVPLCDFLSLALWATSFFGKRVHWREHTYLLSQELG